MTSLARVAGPHFDVLPTDGVPVYMWNHGVHFEDEAIQQVVNLAKMPFVFKHVALMPDAHAGIGSTIGSVFATKGAVLPACVGTDLGCGMVAARLNLTREQVVHISGQIRTEIERLVPMGRTNNGGPGDRGAWGDIPHLVRSVWEQSLEEGFEAIGTKHPSIAKGNTVNHLGTLGTGNHFIELQFDEQDRVWIMLHSGSRGVGNRIGQYFIHKAKELCTRWFVPLPDKDLAFISQDDVLYSDYIFALNWAQQFAYANRQLLLEFVMQAVRRHFPDAEVVEEINTHHNFARQEHHFNQNVLLTRKGAISARAGEIGIIPGSMGARSYIVKGLGNPLSFYSCSHGAGRAMSRTKARQVFTVEDHKKAVAGVDCRTDEAVLDETPGAYKNIDAVIEAEKDLVEVVHTLKAILCCKG